MSFLGSIVSGLFGKSAAKDQMDFQRSMSDTAHQREVADLKKAGLNPILSATGGPGASTPQGAMATMPPFENPITTALMMKKLSAEKENVEQKTNESKATETFMNAQGKSASAKALVEQIGALRKLEEFKNLDLDPKGRGKQVIGWTESLPTPFKGLIRSMFTGKYQSENMSTAKGYHDRMTALHDYIQKIHGGNVDVARYLLNVMTGGFFAKNKKKPVNLKIFGKEVKKPTKSRGYRESLDPNSRLHRNWSDHRRIYKMSKRRK